MPTSSHSKPDPVNSSRRGEPSLTGNQEAEDVEQPAETSTSQSQDLRIIARPAAADRNLKFDIIDLFFNGPFGN